MNIRYDSILKILFIVGFSSTALIFAMEQRTAQSSNYYTKENIQSLKAKGVRVHNPMTIITDQSGDEGRAGIAGAMTTDLAAALRAGLSPIIVSFDVLHRLFTAIALETAPTELSIENIAANWLFFDVPESQYVLLVPNSYVELFGDMGLKIGKSLETLVPISEFLKLGFNKFLMTMAEQRNKFSYHRSAPPRFSINDFKKIFKTKISSSDLLPIWDFSVHGHGGFESGKIAGLPSKDFEYSLEFF